MTLPGGIPAHRAFAPRLIDIASNKRVNRREPS